MNYIIITNNPLVQSSYPPASIICAKDYLDVLKQVRDHIHQGFKLLSHPQAGSIKPYETPYRSVIISKESTALDYKSLQYIENAIERFETLSTSMGFRDFNNDERILNDFQVIDAGLIKTAVASFNM